MSQMIRAISAVFVIALSLMLSPGVLSANPTTAAWEQFARGDAVLLLRHALAPGNGDPVNFQVKDCSTQRNLAQEGRAQARQIGQRLRALGISEARVWSSQWCRCLETAKLLNLGEATELSGLNSFYELSETREPNLRMLRAHLRDVARDGPPIILVTHYVTIGALMGTSLGSGEGVLARIDDDGGLTALTSVAFGVE